MPLRPRDKKPVIPATSSEPAKCRWETDGTRCGKEAHKWLTVTVEILDRTVNTKLPFCNEHWEKVKPSTEGLSTDVAS